MGDYSIIVYFSIWTGCKLRCFNIISRKCIIKKLVIKQHSIKDDKKENKFVQNLILFTASKWKVLLNILYNIVQVIEEIKYDFDIWIKMKIT